MTSESNIENRDNSILLSIITVCYNADNDIENTIRSVTDNINQKDIEYIIIDGGSNDRTLEIINLYKSKINICISEKDSGIYDAMNKGLKLSSGKLVYFINAGDTL